MKGLLFTYVMTYGGAFFALLNPFVGLLVYVCFAIIKPESLWFWSVPQGNYSRIVALGLLAGWALHGFGNWALGKAQTAIGLLICFVIWSGLCALGAAEQEVAWRLVEGFAKIVLPVVAGATLIDSVAKLKQLIWVIVLSQG